MSLAFDEFGRPFIIIKARAKDARDARAMIRARTRDARDARARADDDDARDGSSGTRL